MSDLSSIYTRENCRFSAPLQWSLAIFWREPEPDDSWRAQLADDLEPDAIRNLSHHFIDAKTSQFSISTQPCVSPLKIVERTKGRLYHLVRGRKPKPFKKNYSVRSIGNATRNSVENCVANQLDHHKMADATVQARLTQYQFVCTDVDLSQMRRTSHGAFWFNLHLVLVHRERWKEIRHEVLSRVRSMVLGVSKQYSYRLARAGILPDHVHLVLGCSIESVSGEIALQFLNNLAFVRGMKPVYQFGGFVGTVGEYTNKAF